MGNLGSKQRKLLVTGSNGFLGQAIVRAAVARGHLVRCLIRESATVPDEWTGERNITVVRCTLAEATCAEDLVQEVGRADFIIHAAAGMAGDDLQHEYNTIRPTKALISALTTARVQQSSVPDVVLISSLSVYGGMEVRSCSTLDELSELESTPQMRDAYCRAKLKQEAMINAAAQEHDLNVRVLRPGAIFGKNRLWNSHLGQAFGPVLAQMEWRGEVPLSYVDHCALAVVLAAEVPIVNDDRGERVCGGGCVEFINVVDDERPTRADYVSALQRTGWPKVVLPLPWWLIAKLAKFLHGLGLSSRVPGLLREAVLHARMKPMNYSNARLKDRLGWVATMSFEQALQATLNSDGAEGAD